MTFPLITFIIIPIVALLIGFFTNTSYDPDPIDNFFEKIETALGGLLIGLFIGAVVWVFGALGSEMRTTTKISEILYLESIQDNRTQTSSYVLGTGGSHSIMSYTFYAKESNGRIKLYEIPNYKAEIEYLTDTNKLPRVEIYSSYIDQTDKRNLFMHPKLTKRGGIYLNVEPKYLIIVPKGTIKSNFELDAQ